MVAETVSLDIEHTSMCSFTVWCRSRARAGHQRHPTEWTHRSKRERERTSSARLFVHNEHDIGTLNTKSFYHAEATE